MEKYRFFNEGAEDLREYNAEDFAEYFARVLTNGVLNGGTNLLVTTTGTDMHSNIADGYAWIDGYLYKVEDGHVLTHPVANPTYDRIDRVVVRLDRSIEHRYVKAFVVAGTPAASPEPPELIREGDVYELSLAQVLVRAGMSTIAPENVTDERLDASVCGLVNSRVQVDTAHMQAEWDAYMDQLKTQGYASQPDFLAHTGNAQAHGRTSLRGAVHYTETILASTTATLLIPLGGDYYFGKITAAEPSAGATVVSVMFTEDTNEAIGYLESGEYGAVSTYGNLTSSAALHRLAIGNNVYFYSVRISSGNIEIKIINSGASSFVMNRMLIWEVYR